MTTSQASKLTFSYFKYNISYHLESSVFYRQRTIGNSYTDTSDLIAIGTINTIDGRIIYAGVIFKSYEARTSF